MSATTSAYDQVDFPSYPFPASHPDRLATVAYLAGMEVLDVSSSRVLELGCGAAGNLLPLADTFPRSQFVGVDFSRQQIEIAEQVRDAIGLTNLQLLDRDILTLDESLGEFDFIICHGVFSWTTEDVRDKILSVCATRLSPNGIALINYNTYPGWHVQNWVRDMIRTRAVTFDAPDVRIREARTMIDLLVSTFKPQSLAHHNLVMRELENIQKYSDEFLFHAILNFSNQPFYLHEFVRRCNDHSLQYIADADPTLAWSGTVPRDAAARFDQLFQNQVEFEQHLDFVNNTTSRRSLICRESAEMSQREQSQRLSKLHVSGQLRSVSSQSDPSASSFQSQTGRRITTRNVGLSQVLQTIADAWPESIPFGELDDNQSTDRSSWESDFLNCYATGLVALSLHSSQCIRTPDETPRATQLARWQAVHQDFVTNLRHQAIRLEQPHRELLPCLTGARSVSDLAALRSIDEASIVEQLGQLAQHALLLTPTDREA